MKVTIELNTALGDQASVFVQARDYALAAHMMREWFDKAVSQRIDERSLNAAHQKFMDLFDSLPRLT